MFAQFAQSTRDAAQGLFGRQYGFFDLLTDNGQLTEQATAQLLAFQKPKAPIVTAPVAMARQAA
ncbi:hypothetical protein JCM17844_22320 [Iodidimonas gelatinilytica]|uniref:Uncharacterized protein n=1 Tax=Iodidimonas gelatinilytica TaxID=1236966 RepID=A0A5A7MUM6_9PROT|nr:hypothetical protein [Iodidimonas gelatinilytica]GEQ98595.1 hypothetical protein JCM17844_22320 [Iodidimonas gelatinilytica]